MSTRRYVLSIIVGFIVLLLLINRPFVTIDSAERGLVYEFGAVQDIVLTEGFHTITPFITKVKQISIVPMTIDTTVGVNAQGAITKDNQTIGSDMTLFYRFSENELVNIAENYGFDMLTTKMSRDLEESFKQVIGQYTIFDVAGAQEEIRGLVMSGLITKIGDYPVIIDDVKITNYDWSDDFDNQIAMTMKIAQEAKQQEQELKKIEISAQQQVVQAEANFQAEKLNADALVAKGEGIKKYNQSIVGNPKSMQFELEMKKYEVELARIAKWNGVYVSQNNYAPIPVSAGAMLGE